MAQTRGQGDVKPNEEMIRQAQKKLRCEKVSFINGRAENIPFKDKS